MTVTRQQFASVDEVLGFFAGDGDGSNLNEYARMHAPRYVRLLAVLREQTSLQSLTAPRIADVGAGLQTELLAAHRPDARITTVGFTDHHQRSHNGHIDFDLNEAYALERWPVVDDQFDLVLFCEVIEHLYTTPVAVLAWIRSIIKPGGFLVMQTPNAQAVTRRICAVLGKPLYGHVTHFGGPGMNPGHFREYTPAELRQMGEDTGFAVAHLEIANYFAHEGRRGRAMMAVYALMPSGMRQGVTVVYRAT